MIAEVRCEVFMPGCSYHPDLRDRSLKSLAIQSVIGLICTVFCSIGAYVGNNVFSIGTNLLFAVIFGAATMLFSISFVRRIHKERTAMTSEKVE